MTQGYALRMEHVLLQIHVIAVQVTVVLHVKFQFALEFLQTIQMCVAPLTDRALRTIHAFATQIILVINVKLRFVTVFLQPII